MLSRRGLSGCCNGSDATRGSAASGPPRIAAYQPGGDRGLTVVPPVAHVLIIPALVTTGPVEAKACHGLSSRGKNRVSKGVISGRNPSVVRVDTEDAEICGLMARQPSTNMKPPKPVQAVVLFRASVTCSFKSSDSFNRPCLLYISAKCSILAREW